MGQDIDKLGRVQVLFVFLVLNDGDCLQQKQAQRRMATEETTRRFMFG